MNASFRLSLDKDTEEVGGDECGRRWKRRTKDPKSRVGGSTFNDRQNSWDFGVRNVRNTLPLPFAHSGVGRIGRLLGVPFRSKRSRAAPYLSYTYDPHRRTSCPLHDQSSSTFVFFCSLGLPQIFFRLFSRSGCVDVQMGIGRT